MPDIAELIARLEKATGRDFKLDADIALSVGWRVGGANIWAEPGENFSAGSRPPYYTASIDSALTLVPEGWEWSVGSGTSDAPGFAEVWPTSIEIPEPHHQVWAKTPALALCIAAIKARTAVRGITNK